MEVGIDILDLNKIDKLKTRKNFYRKFFTDREMAYIEKKNYSNQTIGGMIAGKEAVAKAFKVGISKELGLRDMEILHSGYPYLNTKNEKVSSLLKRRGSSQVDLNISHDGNYAIASCIISGPESVEIDGDMKKLLPEINEDYNKYDYGNVLVIGGSRSMAGSVILASKAAHRMGAGLVHLMVPDSIEDRVSTHLIETIIHACKSDSNGAFAEVDKDSFLDFISRMDAVAIGPGLGRGGGARQILRLLIENYDRPILVDADGINLLAGEKDLLDQAKKLYLTPHAKEFSRLSGYSMERISEDRMASARDFIKDHDVNLLLKGKNTIVINREDLYVNKSGNSSLATAGSGDVLTGISLGLLGRKEGLDSLKLAAYIHGLAADSICLRMGQDSLIASDIVDELGHIMKLMRS